MKRFSKIICLLLCLLTVFSLTCCMTEEEKEKFEADNLARAENIAENHFSDDFKYDFHFYGGAAEGAPNIYIYVYTDGYTINCIQIPGEEKAPDPYVYYDCELHQYSGGAWDLLHYEDSERAVE